MKDFITALQFLTRVRIFSQTSWQEDSFSRSVPWFPLVGAVIGALLAGLNYILLPHIDTLLRAVILVLAEILITGGLFCDGLMDTADGVFSGRSRERMLEIMKDSTVGSNAVIVFFCVFVLKIALYTVIAGNLLTMILFAMLIVTRCFLVISISCFPYARKEGIGGMFTKYSKKYYLPMAIALLLICLLPLKFVPIYLAAIACFIYSYLVADYLVKVLGGLTGDTYGFIAETGNVVFIFFVYLCLTVNIFGGLRCF